MESSEAQMKTKTCPDCNGDGVLDKGTDDEHQCPTCGGCGFVPADDDDEDVLNAADSPQFFAKFYSLVCGQKKNFSGTPVSYGGGKGGKSGPSLRIETRPFVIAAGKPRLLTGKRNARRQQFTLIVFSREPSLGTFQSNSRPSTSW